jgi:hypothetical protein
MSFAVRIAHGYVSYRRFHDLSAFVARNTARAREELGNTAIIEGVIMTEVSCTREQEPRNPAGFAVAEFLKKILSCSSLGPSAGVRVQRACNTLFEFILNGGPCLDKNAISQHAVSRITERGQIRFGFADSVSTGLNWGWT